MIPLEYEISRLKTLFTEMHELVREQVNSTRLAFLNNDISVACEVMRKESRVNFYELTIDKECEDFLALHRPVASDLRLTIALIKMSGNLERIGDHAYRVSSFMCDHEMKLTDKLKEQIKLVEIFDEIDHMMANSMESFAKHDVNLAKKIFKQDKLLNKINKKMPKLGEKYAKKHKEETISNLILLSRAIGKLERMGDLIKNNAEETIFYIESIVLKHKKKNKKIRKRFDMAE
jgi:phosphate transport system protein